MKEQIIALIDKIGTQIGWTETGWEKIYTKEDCAEEIEKLFRQTYLNECIEKATPNLSKIKDVDKELAEIKGEDRTCRNCKYKVLPPISKPCSYCLGFDEWKTDQITIK